ncbi:MAG: LiaF-related protein [Caldilineaceae bacterium]
MQATIDSEKRKASLFGPLVLIGVGILLLLSNLGVLDLNLWELLFRFWPLFLIAAGLDVLIGRRTNSGALIALLLIIGVVVGSIWLGYVSSTSFESVSGQTIAQALEDAARAQVKIESSVSQMKIGAATDPTQLVTGNIALHNNEELKHDFQLSNGIAYYTLQSDSHSFILPSFGRREDGLWDLQLNPKVPTDLNISTGVGSATLDLSLLNLTGLAVDTGVGSVEITLPARGNFTASLHGGVGELAVLIPDTVAARITANAGIGSVQVDGDYSHQGGVYTSPNYDSAVDRVDLSVDGGIGSISVRQISQR